MSNDQYSRTLDFSKPIVVFDWNTREVVAELPADGNTGLHVMARSNRWDNQHCGPDVRTIDPVDIQGPLSEVSCETPVLFLQ